MEFKGISIENLALYVSGHNDKQSLDQAILVCKAQAVDLKEVKRWAKNEEMENKFKLFLKDLIKE